MNGTALIQQTFVSIRWEWITLLIIQVALSIIVLIVAISHTEIIGIPVIKGNPLPGLFAIGAQERYAVEQEQMGVKASGETPWKSEHVLDGDFKRFGNKWALGSLGYQREESRRVETVYVGEPGKWPA